MSETRLYLGNLPRSATKKEVEDFFLKEGHASGGSIVEVKLMNGFGFIEYADAADARDMVPIMHGKMFKDARLTVQFARGARTPRDYPAPNGDRPPRPRRTPYRMNITGLPTDTSWQDLKDFARKSGVDVVFSEVSRLHDGTGFVEYETGDDLRTAVNKLDNYDFKGCRVTCTSEDRHSRARSRSPVSRGGRGGYSPRGPPARGYSPRGGRGNYSPPPREYRDRSPYGAREPAPRRSGEYRGERRYESPPRRAPPDDYYGSSRGSRYDEPPPRGRYDEEPRGGRSGSYGGGGGGGGGSGNYGPPPRNRSPPPRYREDDYSHRSRSERYER